MPVYEYECEKCGYEFEVEQSIHDKPRSRCPECRGKVNKVFNSVGIVFKGSGFYCTDARNGGSRVKPAECKAAANGKSDCSTGACPAAEASGKAATPPSCQSCGE
jgi:putative FmdB family regulatory protein